MGVPPPRLWVGVRVACGVFNVALGVLRLASVRWLGPLAWLAALPLAGAALIFWTVYRLLQDSIHRVRELEQSRAHVVDDSAARLRQIERDLHDGAQAQMVAVTMKLGLATKKLGGMVDGTGQSELDRVLELVAAAHRGAKEAIIELRDLARGPARKRDRPDPAKGNRRPGRSAKLLAPGYRHVGPPAAAPAGAPARCRPGPARSAVTPALGTACLPAPRRPAAAGHPPDQPAHPATLHPGPGMTHRDERNVRLRIKPCRLCTLTADAFAWGTGCADRPDLARPGHDLYLKRPASRTAAVNPGRFSPALPAGPRTHGWPGKAAIAAAGRAAGSSPWG